MPYDVRQSVMDALDACRKIQAYTQGHTLETYRLNSRDVDAVERRFEILGEAFNRMISADPSFRVLFPEAGKIIGARNRIAHGYETVDDEVIWTASQDNIPRLAAKLAEWLDEHQR